MAIRVERFASSTGKGDQSYIGAISDISDYEVTIRFSSAGRERRSVFDVRIETSSFKDLAKAMMAVEPTVAIRAFGLALKDHK